MPCRGGDAAGVLGKVEHGVEFVAIVEREQVADAKELHDRGDRRIGGGELVEATERVAVVGDRAQDPGEEPQAELQQWLGEAAVVVLRSLLEPGEGPAEAYELRSAFVGELGLVGGE